MTGSQKQIDWANQLQASFAAAMSHLEKKLTGVALPPAEQACVDALRTIGGIDSAAWWIDNRSFFADKKATDRDAMTLLTLVQRGAIKVPATL